MATARKQPSGRWRIRVYSHTEPSGKKVYLSFYGDTKREAELLALQYKNERKVKASNITVEQAVQRYIDSKRNILSAATIMGYECIFRNHLKPLLRKRVSQLTSEIVQKYINEEANSVSAKTVSNIYGLLSAAVKQQDPNIVFHVRLPRRVKKLRMDLPSSQDVIEAVHGTEIELPVLLALCLCLRLSEVRGIKKDAVHNGYLDICRVRVSVKGVDVESELLKNDASRRIVELPPFLEKMIVEHDGEYVTDLSGRALYGRFVNLMKKHGHIVRFHDLRHIAASDMNRLGIPDKVAADRGGWATTGTMRSVYQHSFSQDRRTADETVNNYYEQLLKEAEDKGGK